MGLFNRSEIILFTCEGFKKLYQFFLLSFGIILFQIIVVNSLLLGLSPEYVTGVLYIIIVFQIFVILWLFWAFIDLVNGRKEFDKHHEIIVIIASAFLIPSIFLYLIRLVVSKGLPISAASFYFSPTGDLATVLVQSPLLLAVSFVLPILIGMALFLFIYRFSTPTEKVPLMFAFGLLVTSPLTMYVTALIAYFLFFGIYRSVYRRLSSSNIRPTDSAPCPFCDKDISIESKQCPYCGTKFKENHEARLDPRLTFDLSKKEIMVPHGYTPVKGPTEEQKKRLFKILGLIIALIVIVAIIALVLRQF